MKISSNNSGWQLSIVREFKKKIIKNQVNDKLPNVTTSGTDEYNSLFPNTEYISKKDVKESY